MAPPAAGLGAGTSASGARAPIEVPLSPRDTREDIFAAVSEEELIEVSLRIPRSAFLIAAPAPATVTQHTADQHFGISLKHFRMMARDGLFPSKRIGRVLFAKYDDVYKAVTDGATATAWVTRRRTSAGPDETTDHALSAAEIRRYLEGARTRRELRERKTEMQGRVSALLGLYDAKLEDGSPNPSHDLAKYKEAVGLWLTIEASRYYAQPPR